MAQLQLPVHPYSVAAFCVELLGYVGLCTFLQYVYYHRQGATPAAWKSQPDSQAHLPDGLGAQVRAVPNDSDTTGSSRRTDLSKAHPLASVCTDGRVCGVPRSGCGACLRWTGRAMR